MAQLRWINTLCLVTIGISGLMSVQSFHLEDCPGAQELRYVREKAYYFPIEITNRVFTTALQNPESEEYNSMYEEVRNLLDSIYGCCDTTTCPTNHFYAGVAAMTFRSGSVIANATLVFNTMSINAPVCHIYFLLNFNKFKPDNLEINLDYTTIDKIKRAEVPKTTTTTTTTTERTTTTTTTTTATTTTPTTTITTTPTTTTTATTTTPTTTITTTPTTTTTTATTTTPTTTITTTPTTTTTATTTPTTTITTTPTTTTTATTTTPTTTTTTPTTTPTTTTTTKLTTTKTPTRRMTTTTTPTSTKSETTTTPITPALTSTRKTNTSSDTILVSTTKANDGNHSNIHTDSHHVSTGKPNDHLTPGGSSSSSSSSSSDWVPGWAIALLVLASAILLLLIIIFIMMLVQQCCKKTESGHMDTAEDPYYNEMKQPPQDSLPIYSPQTPETQQPASTPVIIGGTPSKNKAGFYAVNP